MLKPAAIILLCAVPAGWLAGRAWSSQDAGVSGKKAGDVAAHASERPVKKEALRKREMDKEEFIASIWEHLEATMAPGFNPMGDELAAWTDGELIAALQESITDPALHGLPGQEGNATLFLLQEWMKRDPAASAKWGDSLDSTMLKGQLAPCIAACWPADRGEEGLAFLLGNPVIFGNGTGAPLLTKAMDSAAAKGPAAVNDLLRAARENGLDYVHVRSEFPPDFDFKTLAAAGELKQAVEKDPANPAILAWSRQDRDAAFQWTLQNVGAKETFDQLLPKTGGTLTWSAARYEAMDAGEREELRSGFLGPRLLEVPYFSSAIQDPVLRDEVRMQGVQGVFVSDRGGAMMTAEAMLELLGPPERRLEILENLERGPWPPSAGRQTPVDEARLRELMGGWTTDQTRIDTIIDRLKKP